MVSETETVATTETMTREYRVWARNLGPLTAAIERLNKRARKLRLAEITLETVATEDTADPSDPTGMRMVRRYQVRITGQAPVISGWQYVATLDHTEAGVIIRAVPEVEEGALASYRTAANTCDHCHTSRRRVSTYILAWVESYGHVGDGATPYKQVGSNCLRDFLGDVDPHHMAELGEMWIEAIGAANSASEGGFGSGDHTLFATDLYLGAVATAIRQWGWLSRGKAREEPWHGLATADRTLLALEHDRHCARQDAGLTGAALEECPLGEHLFQTDADVEIANAALAWVLGFEEGRETLSDYEYNLFIACNLGALEYKQLGIVASAVSSYQRDLDKRAEQAKRDAERERDYQSQWQGEVGKRQTFDLTCVGIREFESDWGTRTLYTLRDADGDVFVWWSSGYALRLDRGATYALKGTVKAHGEYTPQGRSGADRVIRQTELSRCVLAKTK